LTLRELSAARQRQARQASIVHNSARQRKRQAHSGFKVNYATGDARVAERALQEDLLR
jgi:hypothetical protein